MKAIHALIPSILVVDVVVVLVFGGFSFASIVSTKRIQPIFLVHYSDYTQKLCNAPTKYISSSPHSPYCDKNSFGMLYHSVSP